MSFTLWMDLRADLATVYELLADMDDASPLSTRSSSCSSTMVVGCSWQRQMPQVYLRSRATFHCLVADKETGSLQWEMSDGFHMARFTYCITSLDTGVRLHLDVSCYIIVSGASTPSEQLAAMMKRGEVKKMQELVFRVEASNVQHSDAPATCQQQLVCQ